MRTANAGIRIAIAVAAALVAAPAQGAQRAVVGEYFTATW
jgi:hypothetical protein